MYFSLWNEPVSTLYNHAWCQRTIVSERYRVYKNRTYIMSSDVPRYESIYFMECVVQCQLRNMISHNRFIEWLWFIGWNFGCWRLRRHCCDDVQNGAPAQILESKMDQKLYCKSLWCWIWKMSPKWLIRWHYCLTISASIVNPHRITAYIPHDLYLDPPISTNKC